MMGRWSGFEKLQRFLRFSGVQGQPTLWAAGMKENVQPRRCGRLLVRACFFLFFSRELSLWRGCRKRVLTSRFTFPSRKSLAPCLWTLPRLPINPSSATTAPAHWWSEDFPVLFIITVALVSPGADGRETLGLCQQQYWSSPLSVVVTRINPGCQAACSL